MKAFKRQPPPDFWIDRICQWIDLLAKPGSPKGNKLHDWTEEGRSLAEWFHDTVRPHDEGALCAYCDGLLGTQSPKTIDHWIPKEECPALALWWWNLFPACYGCQAAKRTQWPEEWLRPDVDDVEALIEPNLITGQLEPSPDAPNALRLRIQGTIDGLGLNRPDLVRERRQFLRDLYARSAGSIERQLELAQDGPYRFLAIAM